MLITGEHLLINYWSFAVFDDLRQPQAVVRWNAVRQQGKAAQPYVQAHQNGHNLATYAVVITALQAMLAEIPNMTFPPNYSMRPPGPPWALPGNLERIPEWDISMRHSFKSWSAGHHSVESYRRNIYIRRPMRVFLSAPGAFTT